MTKNNFEAWHVSGIVVRFSYSKTIESISNQVWKYDKPKVFCIFLEQIDNWFKYSIYDFDEMRNYWHTIIMGQNAT